MNEVGEINKGEAAEEETTPVVWISASARNPVDLYRTLAEVQKRIADGERNGKKSDGKRSDTLTYSFAVSGPGISTEIDPTGKTIVQIDTVVDSFQNFETVLTTIAHQVASGKRNNFQTKQPGLVDGWLFDFFIAGAGLKQTNVQNTTQVQPHVVLISLQGEIDATPATSYEDGIIYLRERATAFWQLTEEQEAALPNATVEQLSIWYAGEWGPDEGTWVDILPLIPPWQQRHSTDSSERAGQA